MIVPQKNNRIEKKEEREVGCFEELASQVEIDACGSLAG